MSEITFNANLREKAGKGAARACRREGRILQLFTVAKNAVNISLHPVELEKALDLRDFYKSVITISLNGKSEKVVCKDVQFDPVSDMPIHVDFMRN